MGPEQQSNQSTGGFLSQIAGLFQTPDEQAMWRVQTQDDTEAFALLLNRWEQPIKRLCTRMLHDEHKAEDLTQEAFTRIYSKRKDYQHGGKFSTFLWRIAVNLCLDELRRIKRRREFAVLDTAEQNHQEHPWENLASDQKSPEEMAVSEEQARMVQRAIQQLPEHYRAVVVLRHYENLKFREVAEVLDIPVGTAKSRMSEALDLLAQSLAALEKAPSPVKHNPRFPMESIVI
jgi:RNA polymerase sigma-70 factor (ECF subfamily)